MANNDVDDFPRRFAGQLMSGEPVTDTWELELFDANLHASGPGGREEFAHELGRLWALNEYGPTSRPEVKEMFSFWLKRTVAIDFQLTGRRYHVRRASAEGMAAGRKHIVSGHSHNV